MRGLKLILILSAMFVATLVVLPAIAAAGNEAPPAAIASSTDSVATVGIAGGAMPMTASWRCIPAATPFDGGVAVASNPLPFADTGRLPAAPTDIGMATTLNTPPLPLFFGWPAAAPPAYAYRKRQ